MGKKKTKRKREREREQEGKWERERESKRERECVCVCEREREPTFYGGNLTFLVYSAFTMQRTITYLIFVHTDNLNVPDC